MKSDHRTLKKQTRFFHFDPIASVCVDVIRQSKAFRATTIQHNTSNGQGTKGRISMAPKW